jgi:hypothetical protein
MEAKERKSEAGIGGCQFFSLWISHSRILLDRNLPVSSGGPAADVARQDSACLTFASFRYGISVDSAVSQSHSRISLDYLDSRICGSQIFGGVQGNYARSMSLAV